ncbi:MAG: autophagy protein 6 [Pycnora praestabilis]|nr:MAG: autophagy protein 6 [Pycnora praestabilis]
MYCQKCRTPLKVDSSLDDLNPAAFDLLLGATGTSLHQSKALTQSKPAYPQDRKELYDKASESAQSPTFKRVIPAPRHGQEDQTSATRSSMIPKDNPAMSFVMLTESQVVPPPSSNHARDGRGNPKARRKENVGHVEIEEKRESLSHRMEITTRLFEIMSSRSDIDHPICVECTELLVDGLQKRLGNATRERDAYVEFLKKVNIETPTEEDRQKAEADLKATREQENVAFAELQDLEKEKAAVDRDIVALEEEARRLDFEEEKFWRERNAFALTLSSFQNERDGVNLQFDHDSRQLERLQRTNVYNDTFCIGHDGFFGTINSLRLGRLANPPVEWAEINAAWGQTLLLLATVAEKLDFAFDGFRLRPMGSMSRIEKIEYPQSASTNTSSPSHPAPAKVSVLELYSSGDLPLGRMFLHRRFDSAMVAFLECLRQLGAYVEHASVQGPSAGVGQGLKLPYEIKKDRIGDASIKLGFNQDEGWTRACKYTLTCCKFLLAHASNVGGSGRRNAS